MLDTSRPFRCYRLNVFPYPSHTVAILTCTDWRGRTESDRRVNTWDLRIHSGDLAAVSEHDALQIILREVLDRLDPPLGDPWAEPPESPVGDYRGQPESHAQLELELDLASYNQSAAVPRRAQRGVAARLGRKSDGQSDGPEVNE